MNTIKKIAIALTVLGAIAFTINGVSGFDFITKIFGNRTVGGDFLRILIGLSSVYVLVSEFVSCKS